MSSLASSYKGAAGAQAMSRGMSPETFASRSEAYASKEKSDQQLKMLQKTRPTEQDYQNQSEIQSQQLELALGELKQAKRNQNLQSTYQAFQRYDADKFDTKHFNQLLTDLDARGASLFSGVSRVDRINTTDIPMMDDWGVSKAHQKLILEDPDVKGSYVKITQKDGTVSFGDMDALKQFAGGYNDYATQREIERQTLVKTKEMLVSVGLPTDKMNIQAFNETKQNFPDVPPDDPEFIEAYQERYEELRTTGRQSYSSGALSNERRYVVNKLAAEGIFEGDQEFNERYDEVVTEYKNLSMPSKQKLGNLATEAQKSLKDMKFLDMDISNLSNDQYDEIETKVRELENYGDAKLDTNAKKHLMRIRDLTHLGDKAGELTKKETGLLDNLWFGAKKYIYEEAPDNTAAAAAYALYRNMARHAQFGSVLPSGELKSFAEAFGSMGMQIGPVLTMLRENLMQQKQSYNAIAEMENRYVMKWRTGMGELQLDDAINKLDHRISMIDAVANDTPETAITTPPSTEKIALTPERKAYIKAFLDPPDKTTQEKPE